MERTNEKRVELTMGELDSVAAGGYRSSQRAVAAHAELFAAT